MNADKEVIIATEMQPAPTPLVLMNASVMPDSLGMERHVKVKYMTEANRLCNLLNGARNESNNLT